MLHNLRDGPKWVPGVVVGQEPLSYYVQTTGGEVWKHHVDQIGEVGDTGSVLSEEELFPLLNDLPKNRYLKWTVPERTRFLVFPSREASAVPNEEGTETLTPPSPSLDQEEMLSTPGQEIPPTRRYPQRIR